MASAGVGPYPPVSATMNAVKSPIDVYGTPALEANSRIAFTNTTPMATHRGAGRPEGKPGWS